MGLLFLLLLLISSFFVGRFIEARHFSELLRREEKLKSLRARTTGKKEHFSLNQGELVFAGVVVGQSYFKSLWAFISDLIGGRVYAYETLLERGRREALLRVKEIGQQKNAKELVNVRFETSAIAVSENNNPSGAIEIFCYATLIY